MGSCLSYLGLTRRGQDPENPETSRLLSSSEPYRGYSNSDQRMRAQRDAHHLPQTDPETLRKERLALEGICHAMSDEVVDVFTAVPDKTGLGSRIQSTDQLHLANALPKSGVKPPEDEIGEAEIQTNLAEEEEPVTKEMAYRSVRNLPDGLLSREMDKGESAAAKAAMGE